VAGSGLQFFAENNLRKIQALRSAPYGLTGYLLRKKGKDVEKKTARKLPLESRKKLPSWYIKP
jgi:hypothetical protein